MEQNQRIFTIHIKVFMKGVVETNAETWIQLFITVLCSVLASSGIWTIILKRMDRNDVKTQMLIGLGHDRIMHLGMTYISRGYITDDEYENLDTYLYAPYEKLGGNGSARRVMEEVRKLEIRRALNLHLTTAQGGVTQ